jgi:hypothetical protein
MVNGESVTIECPIDPYETSQEKNTRVTKDMANELVSACASTHVEAFNDKYAELRIFLEEQRTKIKEEIEEDKMRTELQKKRKELEAMERKVGLKSDSKKRIRTSEGAGGSAGASGGSSPTHSVAFSDAPTSVSKKSGWFGW